jgi:hypothetical protein
MCDEYLYFSPTIHYLEGCSMRKFLVTALTLVALVSSAAVTASAQGPASAFGVGASVGWFGNGGHLVYAVQSNLHLGTQFGLRVSDGNTDLTFAPYGKYLFTSSSGLSPYILGQFYVSSQSANGSSTSSTGLTFGGGIEYFVSKHFGVFGQINVLDLPFSPEGSKAAFGILSPAIGVEFFL